MRIVALMKTWDGEEFVEASLDSIYEHVDAIVMVHSAKSWEGVPGNRVFPVVEGWAERYDYAGKLHHVHIDSGTQKDQYRAGLEYIEREGIDFDVVMAIDVDEVWDDEMFTKAVDLMEAEPDKKCYRPRMQTYLKTIFYRVAPIWGQPTVFLRRPEFLLESPRAWNAPDSCSCVLDTVFFHHFCYVRRSTNDILRKIRTSATADEGEVPVDLDEWRDTKWNKFPAATHFHPFAGRERLWNRIETVWLDDLPRSVVQNEAIMRNYLPPRDMPEDEALLRNLAVGKNLAVDLGTFLGRSAVVMSLGAKRVVTVDLFEQIVGRNVCSDSGQNYDILFNNRPYPFLKVRRWLSQYDNIKVVQDDTADASELIQSSSVDVLFIDGDHSMMGVTRDFFAWLPKIKRDGIVVFHDVNDLHSEVKMFVDTIVKVMPNMIPIELSGELGSLRAFRKVSA